jgi:hypothetical protein
MSRCRHSKNFAIIEFISTYLSHGFENGEYTGGGDTPGSPLTHIELHCFDCGVKKVYSRWRIPKFLKGPMNQCGATPFRVIRRRLGVGVERR